MIAALYIDFPFLVVFDEAITRRNASTDNLWKRVFGSSGGLERLVVFYDAL